MSEYIPREAAVKAAIDGADEWDGGYNRNRDVYIECSIDSVPAADVAEVRHGHWIAVAPGERYTPQRLKCSACGVESFFLSDMYRHCPYCGARMDEEGEK